jgi:NitT/TauT family transport system permease protein
MGSRKAKTGFETQFGTAIKAVPLPLFLICLWTALALWGSFGPLVPSPIAVLRVTEEWIFGDPTVRGAPYYAGTWTVDLVGSIFRAVTGFLIGAACAIALGLFVGWNREVRSFVDPTIHLFRAIPRVSLLPFAIIFLGLGTPPALAMVAIGTFFQVYVQVVQGVQLVPLDLKRAGYMLGCSNSQVLMRVVIPHATPSIFTGLRLGIVYAWTMLVVAEMFAVGSGFGYTLWRAYEFLQVDLLIACVAMISVSGWISDRALVLAFRSKLRWVEKLSGSEG